MDNNNEEYPDIAGVWFENEYKRIYPNNSLASDVIGFTVRGEVCGVLHEKPMGDGGFGYDPIFYVPEFGMTTAQMTKEQKNSISHRGKASRAMAEKLKADLG